MRHVLFVILATLCVHSAMAVMVFTNESCVYDGLDVDSMRLKLSQMDLQPIEGIWYYPVEDMTIGIERMPSDRFFSPQHPPYHVVYLEGNDITVVPGTEIGYIVAGALDEELDLYLYSKCDDEGKLSGPVKCLARLNKAASVITFERPKTKVKVHVIFGRFLPSIFKGISIIPEREEKKSSEGFRKVYPCDGNGDPFNKIRYL